MVGVVADRLEDIDTVAHTDCAEEELVDGHDDLEVDVDLDSYTEDIEGDNLDTVGDETSGEEEDAS